MLFSGMLWCYVMGSFCGIAATLDPRSVNFRTTMDALNLFMQDRGLPRQSRVIIRSFFHKTRHLQYANEEQHLLDMMSPLLQSSVALAANERWLHKIWYFKPISSFSNNELLEHRNFLAAVSLKFAPEAYIMSEQLPPGNLYVLRRGLVCRRLRFWTQGTVWGEDMILENVDLIDFAQATAVTYVEVFALRREDLEEACRMFPTPAARLHRQARKMLVQRLVIRYLRRATNEDVKSFVPREQLKGGEAPLKDLRLEAKIDLLISADPETKQKYDKLIGVQGVDSTPPPAASPSPATGGLKRSALTGSSAAGTPGGAKASHAGKGGHTQSSRSVAKSAALQRLAQANAELIERQQQLADELARLQEMEASDRLALSTPGSALGKLEA
mmetsp:Transcript_6920/g.18182  ORF Transcript_6920/g.18182 Transcript_6920/m.18182 type:complete len:386 (+) Transcript_6920:11-1168(+)